MLAEIIIGIGAMVFLLGLISLQISQIGERTWIASLFFLIIFLVSSGMAFLLIVDAVSRSNTVSTTVP